MSPVAVSFLCHFPSAFAAWDFPSVLPCGVRTFLEPPKRPAATRPAPEIVAPVSYTLSRRAPSLGTHMHSIRRLLRAVKLLARDEQIPRGLRWLAALGLLPVPGPVDEAVLLVLAALLWLFYRERLAAAWRAAADGTAT